MQSATPTHGGNKIVLRSVAFFRFFVSSPTWLVVGFGPWSEQYFTFQSICILCMSYLVQVPVPGTHQRFFARSTITSIFPGKSDPPVNLVHDCTGRRRYKYPELCPDLYSIFSVLPRCHLPSREWRIVPTWDYVGTVVSNDGHVLIYY